MLDSAGVEFDPAIHFADAEGKGQQKKDGTWRKRPGSKKEEGASALLRRIAELEAELKEAQAPKPPAPAVIQAAAELAGLARPEPAPTGVRQLTPYRGFVKALQDCHYGSFFKAGEVFQVDVPTLWSDDPYVPVIVTGHSESGVPVTEANTLAPPAVDFRFRPKTHEAMANLASEPRRASQF